MTEKIKWKFVQEISVSGIAYCEEYVSEDEKFGRLVYNDGYEEIYELAEKSIDKNNTKEKENCNYET